MQARKSSEPRPSGAGDWHVAGDRLYIRNATNTAWVRVPKSYAFPGPLASAIASQKSSEREASGKKPKGK